ncbi:MAG: DNA-directed RNA polymerase subunit beta [Clostridia bacterium]|nr:DNA-directed RNA polymerase subunit beta [Clostridia bacterium]
MARTFHNEKYGTRERVTFSQIEEVLGVPNLIEVQKSSYDTFIQKGIKEVFDDFSPILDIGGNFELHFVDCTLEQKSKYDERQCRERDATYAAPLRVKVRLVRTDTGEVTEQEVFMGDFPLMTETGSFIINGAERVVVSQLVRSPGVYADSSRDKNGNLQYNTTVIPNRGAWLEFVQDGNSNTLHVHVDRNRKLPATVLLRAIGYGTDKEICDLFDDDSMIRATCDKDNAKSERDGLIELYKRLRPGEVPADESTRKQLHDLLFDARRYDLARVGRFKFNKKLSLARRITGKVLDKPVECFDDNARKGKKKIKAGTLIDSQLAWEIQHSGNNVVYVKVGNDSVKVIGNNVVDMNYYMPRYNLEFANVDWKNYGILEYANLNVLSELLQQELSVNETVEAIIQSKDRLVPKHITIDDIIASVSYNLNLKYGLGSIDNIDHLGNRRVRSVGELVQNQLRVGVARLERLIRERMSAQEKDKATPQSLINVRPVSSIIKEFFGSSQLSQFMDQSNPIAELTHKRKLSALGPGGLNRERATFEVRDVHYSHYGRMCPIETPEGQNIGLITSLATYARINEYGFIESPYRRVDKVKHVVTKHIDYLQADDEDEFIVAQANEELENDWFVRPRVTCRCRENIAEYPREVVDYMDVSPKQLVSIATSLIPFLENDDITRALMGSNMQRQAVPLLVPEAPIVATGIEHRIAYDSGVMAVAHESGTVTRVVGDSITVTDKKNQEHIYPLQKFVRSNQGTCINQKPIVHKGQVIKACDILADGPSTNGGELALGRNILVGFMCWEGYNYEDAILISEKLVKEDVFTSIHIEEHEIDCRETKLGSEEFTRDIPNVGEDALKDLDENGIIRIGAEVHPGDIIVGKVTPKGETDLTPEERLLRAIFSEKAREIRDTSLRIPNGEGGIVVDVKIFTRENKDELSPGVKKLVRVYIAQKRKISVGDKMAGRHGNKGCISRILPEEDMPFMEDGTPLQIVLNPLGVPSRMNIGQVLEVHLGLVAKMLGWKIATPVFDGATEGDIKRLFEENGIINEDTGKVDGKVTLYDGRTGEPFENRVTVGYMYMLKLVHLVDDKIHARSVGPYSLVTQQPLGGKAQFGGQRFGEMEVWALEAYGAANILQEILTVKSDDVVGRVKTYESIVKGENIANPGIPESFKVLIKELQSLALDVKVMSEDKEEIQIRDSIDDDTDYSEMTFKEQEQKKALMRAFKQEDSITLEDNDTSFNFADEDESEFDIGDLFGDDEHEDRTSKKGKISIDELLDDNEEDQSGEDDDFSDLLGIEDDEDEDR